MVGKKAGEVIVVTWKLENKCCTSDARLLSDFACVMYQYGSPRPFYGFRGCAH